MKNRVGSMRTLWPGPDSPIYNKVISQDSNQFSIITGLTHDLTGGQELF